MSDILTYKVRFSKDVEDYFIKSMGIEYYKTICQQACKPPSNTCIRINPLQKDPEITMQEVKELLKPYNQQFLDLNEDLVEPYFLNENRNMIIIPSKQVKNEDFETILQLPLVGLIFLIH